ncbi:MAG TPA: NAD(P)H-dependent oxidoreductase subunit E [bacterium]|nr:NAD(P)H-dependent oxidoreductase subunit E [bacterium]
MPIEPNPTAPAAEQECAAVDRVLTRLTAEPQRRDLLPLLHALQDDLGWLPRGALQRLADRMGLPFPDVWGVATFYALFRLDAPHGTIVHVCDDVSCRLRGADALVRQLEARWGPARRFMGEAHGVSHGGAPAAGHVAPADWETVPCLGRCEDAPVAVVAGREHPRATLDEVLAAVEAGITDA